jgi:hypothetical protein
MPGGRLVLVGVLVLALATLPLLLETASVRGRVVDEAGQPVADARVRWQATDLTTRTDARGHFTLPPRQAGARITAAREGYFIAGAVGSPGLVLTLRALPSTDQADYAWVDPGSERGQPGNCASCHGELSREWRTSAHARSATGKHFRNLYEGTSWTGRAGVSWGVLTQNEFGAGVCVSCHAPAVREDEPGFLDLRALESNAAQGVHCDYCHKVEGLVGAIDGLNHGRFNLRLRRPDPAHGEQLFFGPLDDVDRDEDAFSAFQRDSKFCGSCHEGTVFGVPVYTTFSEWQLSRAARQGRSCQACHLRPTGMLTNVAPGHGGKERDPTTLANHKFVVNSLAAMLSNSLSLAGSVRWEAEKITVTVEVLAAQVGHRVPTGYIDRHLILVATAVDGQGQVVPPLTGPRLTALAGSLAGQPGRLFGRVLTDPEGRQPAPFWRARSEVTDTRLSPDHPEVLTWGFPGTVRAVQVRLLYRRFWEEVAVAKGWPTVETIVRERTLVVPVGSIP